MNETAHVDPATPSVEAGAKELAEERRRIDKRDWWVRGYSIFVILLLTFAVISLALPALLTGAETFFNIKLTEAVFGLITLIVLFNIYTIYQEILIKRLRRQLLERADHSHILRNLAMIDPLTGLYNRRFAEQRLAAEVARSERRGHPLTVLTLDLNNVIRGSDLAVRLGGDEFLVVLPECTLEQLKLVLHRLSSFELDWQGRKIPVSFSAGWKDYEMGERPEEMLARADEALYTNKRATKKGKTATKPAVPVKT